MSRLVNISVEYTDMMLRMQQRTLAQGIIEWHSTRLRHPLVKYNGSSTSMVKPISFDLPYLMVVCDTCFFT